MFALNDKKVNINEIYSTIIKVILHIPYSKKVDSSLNFYAFYECLLFYHNVLKTFVKIK